MVRSSKRSGGSDLAAERGKNTGLMPLGKEFIDK
jgi:hypothetical protein